MELSAHGRAVHSVFELAGVKEPALTGAVAFTLSRSAAFARALGDDLGLEGSLRSVHVEQRDVLGGRTDVELHGDDGLRVVLEAKRGWTVPTADQLSRYAARSPELLVAITDCTDRYAHQLGLPDQVAGIPVVHRSWRHLLELVRGAGRDRWVTELRRCLEVTVSTLQDVLSNQVYCVSTGPIGALDGTHGGDFVARDVYFHPHGKRWPTNPPTYLGFRWQGALRTIRHVDSYELVGDLRDGAELDRVSDVEQLAAPHMVYQLGPHIGPPHPLPHGPGYNPRSGRHWVFLDLLLTCVTYREAVTASGERRADAGL